MHKVTEGLVRGTLIAPAREQRFEHGGEIVEFDLLLVETGEPVTTEATTEVDVVGVLRATNNADFGHGRSSAAIGAARHP